MAIPQLKYNWNIIESIADRDHYQSPGSSKKWTGGLIFFQNLTAIKFLKIHRGGDFE